MQRRAGQPARRCLSRPEGAIPNLQLSYDPPGATLAAFRASNALARGLIGPIEGGRKTCAVADILLRAAAGPQRRWRWLAVRAEQSGLDSETIPAWQAQVLPSLGDWDAKGLRHQLGFHLAGRGVDLDIQFLALDRPEHRRRFLSAEATGVWLDGARDLDEAIFDRALQLAGSWPLDEKAAPLVICTSRMPHDGHWLQRRALAGDLQLFHQPGGRTPQAENTRRPKPLDYRRVAEGRPQDWVARHIDALWGAGAETEAERVEPGRLALAVLWALRGGFPPNEQQGEAA